MFNVFDVERFYTFENRKRRPNKLSQIVFRRAVACGNTSIVLFRTGAFVCAAKEVLVLSWSYLTDRCLH